MPPLDECRRLHAAGMTWSHIMPCITACAAMYADDADAAFVQRHMQLLAQLCSWQVQKATQPMQCNLIPTVLTTNKDRSTTKLRTLHAFQHTGCPR